MKTVSNLLLIYSPNVYSTEKLASECDRTACHADDQTKRPERRVRRRRRQQLRRFAEEEKRKFKNSTTSASFHIPSFFGILDYDSSWRELDRRAPESMLLPSKLNGDHWRASIRFVTRRVRAAF